MITRILLVLIYFRSSIPMPHLGVMRWMCVIKCLQSDSDSSCVNENVRGNKGFYIIRVRLSQGPSGICPYILLWAPRFFRLILIKRPFRAPGLKSKSQTLSICNPFTPSDHLVNCLLETFTEICFRHKYITKIVHEPVKAASCGQLLDETLTHLEQLKACPQQLRLHMGQELACLWDWG